MKVCIDGLNIHYVEENKENPNSVLIVHGWGANIRTVMPIVNLLKHKFHVVALDLPCHGASNTPDTVFGTGDFAKVIIKFCDAISLKDFIYIGHSFGGKCGIYLTSKYETEIRTLILVDASGIKEELDEKTKRKVKRFKLMKKVYITLFGEKNIEKFYKRYGSEDYKASSGITRNILVKVVNEDLKDNLKDIKVPTLIVWGDKDDATPLYMGEMMHKEIENSKLIVLQGGHYSYLDDSINFSKYLLNFLDELEEQ